MGSKFRNLGFLLTGVGVRTSLQTGGKRQQIKFVDVCCQKTEIGASPSSAALLKSFMRCVEQSCRLAATVFQTPESQQLSGFGGSPKNSIIWFRQFSGWFWRSLGWTFGRDGFDQSWVTSGSTSVALDHIWVVATRFDLDSRPKLCFSDQHRACVFRFDQTRGGFDQVYASSDRKLLGSAESGPVSTESGVGWPTSLQK